MINAIQILNQAAFSRLNPERLASWKLRYQIATGIQPTSKKTTVAHCRTCNKPHWFFIDISATHVTARCPGH